MIYLKKEYPILEYDPKENALINPKDLIQPIDIPPHCVITFFKEVIDKLVGEGKARKISQETSEMGIHPYYEIEFKGQKIATYLSGVTAPFAAGLFEYIIQLGCRKFICCGSAGLLDNQIHNKIIIPKSAIRDEGTSYHYLPPSREVSPDLKALNAIIDVLTIHHYEFLVTKTWTTDGLYRETKDKISLRKQEGCSVVEMEAAAFFAVAKFRNVQIAQILYGSDDVSGDIWDRGNIGIKIPLREQIFWIAVEACLKL